MCAGDGTGEYRSNHQDLHAGFFNGALGVIGGDLFEHQFGPLVRFPEELSMDPGSGCIHRMDDFISLAFYLLVSADCFGIGNSESVFEPIEPDGA
jgi:hypothetical protein